MKKLAILFSLCALLAACNGSKCSIKPESLTTEYKSDAFTDVASPRFSWINTSGENGAVQTSYHIRVYKDPSHPEKVAWDSGIKISPESVLVPYSGPALEPCTDYWWQVEVRDASGIL